MNPPRFCSICERPLSWHRYGVDVENGQTTLVMAVKLDDGRFHVCRVYQVRDPKSLLEHL
jgi:hypothetical protein